MAVSSASRARQHNELSGMGIATAIDNPLGSAKGNNTSGYLERAPFRTSYLALKSDKSMLSLCAKKVLVTEGQCYALVLFLDWIGPLKHFYFLLLIRP